MSQCGETSSNEITDCYNDSPSNGCAPSQCCEVPSSMCMMNCSFPPSMQPCLNLTSVRKHVVKCPIQCNPSVCCNNLTRRKSFKPVACVSSGQCEPMCFGTTYMKAFNNSTSCCLPNCCLPNC